MANGSKTGRFQRKYYGLLLHYKSYIAFSHAVRYKKGNSVFLPFHWDRRLLDGEDCTPKVCQEMIILYFLSIIIKMEQENPNLGGEGLTGSLSQGQDPSLEDQKSEGRWSDQEHFHFLKGITFLTQDYSSSAKAGRTLRL